MLALAFFVFYTLLQPSFIPLASASSVVGPWYGGGRNKIAPKVFIIDAVSHGPLRVPCVLPFRMLTALFPVRR